MGIVFALLILLACAAVVYGVFFLIFKIIWLIAKKDRNKWPLILAGAATALSTLAVIISFYTAYSTFVKPFTGLAQSALSKTTLTQGVRPYKDTRFGFTFNTFGGIEFSDWINYEGVNMKVGFDTNTMVLSKQAKDEAARTDLPISAFFILRNPEDERVNIQEFLQETLEDIQSVNGQSQLQLTSAKETIIGSQPAILASGVYNDANRQDLTLDLYFLASAEGNDEYYIFALAKGTEAYKTQVISMLESFRLPSSVPAATQATPASSGLITGFVPTTVMMD